MQTREKTTTRFVLRTARGRDVYQFDDLHRALRERTLAEQRIGIPLTIVKLTTTEEELDT